MRGYRGYYKKPKLGHIMPHQMAKDEVVSFRARFNLNSPAGAFLLDNAADPKTSEFFPCQYCSGNNNGIYTIPRWLYSRKKRENPEFWAGVQIIE